MEPIVHGLEQRYGDRMAFEIVDYGAGDAPARIARYGIEVHGMVITDQDDGKLWVESGHKQTAAGVEAAIEQVLGQ